MKNDGILPIGTGERRTWDEVARYYEGQLRELAAVVRGERPNDQDYDRDLRVHDLTLRMIRN